MPRISKTPSVASEILEGLNEALADARKEMKLRTVEVPISEVTAARQAMRLTQAEFSRLLDIPLPTIRKWERGSAPSGAAATLLKVIKRNPDAVRDALLA